MKASLVISAVQSWCVDNKIAPDSVVFHDDHLMYWSGSNFVKVPYKKIKDIKPMKFNLMLFLTSNVIIFLHNETGVMQVEFNG